MTRQRSKNVGHTAGLLVMVRPETRRAIRRLAAAQRTTIADVVRSSVGLYAATVKEVTDETGVA